MSTGCARFLVNEIGPDWAGPIDDPRQIPIVALPIIFRHFRVTFTVVYLRLRIFAHRRPRLFSCLTTTGNL